MALNCSTSGTASAKRLPDRYLGGAVAQPCERADADAARAGLDHLRTLTAVIDTSAQRADSVRLHVF
jgi:hypothetical protein